VGDGSRPPAGPTPTFLSIFRNLAVPHQESKTLVWDPTPSTPVWDWKRTYQIVAKCTLDEGVVKALAQRHLSAQSIRSTPMEELTFHLL